MIETILLAFAWLCLVTGASLAAYVISKEIVFYWKESR